ncbi:hypothetical protein EVG20_g369 [Dentipellis fragilis]|uniref:Nucleolar 27S pre-rRNA processing Urb2/Npa2 C-terminal domain-containing protein n=1 Tax=Dentipellis fragilis TaxID=205917 RepID=A0A4Y9ZF52_9AGAM|nr:hypothetical protein EVG20_g369 [Dentipellis fragilis]
MANYLQSSQIFVRALKAPSDPPKPGDPTKIEIARQAWNTTSFRVPNKGETIVEFLLTRLLKDRIRDGALNPVLDVRYWQLLDDILLPSEAAENAAAGTRATKAWLLPLLNRTPIVPVVTSLLMLSEQDSSAMTELYTLAATSLAMMWPIAIQKATPDMLLDCFGALLGAMVTVPDPSTQGFIKIAHLVVVAMRAAFSNSSNKKKLYQSFLQNHFTKWLHCVVPTDAADGDATISADIYTAGTEILFNVDVLKLFSDTTLPKDFTDAIELSALSHPLVTVGALPKIFRSFSQSVKRSRSALFGHADGSIVEARHAAVRFYAFCETLLEKLERIQDNAAWKTRVALLEVVETESLFSTDHVEAEASLKHVVEACVAALESSTDDAHRAIVFEALSALVRIDHDLVDPSIPRILRRLVTDHGRLGAETSPSSDSASQFLALILTYHARTRSIPTHVSRILASFFPPLPQPSTWNALDVHSIASTSPLLSYTHLEKITRAVHAYLTPGQALEATQELLEALRRPFDEYAEAVKAAAADDGQGSRKKRRKSEQTSSSLPRVDADAWAVSFSLTAKFVSAVLVALPVRTVTEAVRQEIREAIAVALNGFVKSAVRYALQSFFNRETARVEHVWEHQVLSAAALRFRYDILAANELQVPTERDDAEEETMLYCLATGDALPEWQVELARCLVRQAIHEDTPYSCWEELLDPILTVCRRNLNDSTLDVTRWSGKSSSLTDGAAGMQNGAVALLHLVLDRWLSIIDTFGSESQHQLLSSLLLEICALKSFGTRFDQGLTPSTSFTAQLLFMVNTQTQFLDQVDVAQLLSRTVSSQAGRQETLQSEISKTNGAFAILLYAPIEYISRNLRQVFVRRAIVMDVQLGLSGSDRSGNIAVRGLLYRLFTFFGSAESQVTRLYLQYLLRPAAVDPEAVDWEIMEDYTDITLDLIETHFQTLLAAAEKGSDDDLVAVLKGLQEGQSSLSSKTNKHRLDVSVPAIGRFVGLLMSKYPKTAFKEPTISSIQALYEHVVRQVQPAVTSLVTCDRNNTEVIEGANVLEVWRQCVLLGIWLSSNPPDLSLGKRVAQAVTSAAASWPALATMSEEILRPISETCCATLGILLAELQCAQKEDRESQLGMIVAAYTMFSEYCDDEGQDDLDDHVRKAARILSTGDFSFVLGIALEALAGHGNVRSFPSLVSFSTILLHDAPDGTLKIVQEHLTQYLETFVNNPIFCEGPVELRLKVLAFVNTQCSDRPAYIRPINLMTIWSLISKLLSGSSTHDTETSYPIFDEIVSILSALVRLRRDLVLNTLPHLCIALRGLIQCLRSPRPQLGAKQLKLVTDTLPRWIHAAQPLGSDESRALSRLLTTLAAKSVIRTYSARTDLQKPESLARPLSKHVAYVIQSYVEAMDDPLCAVTSNVRRELQAGLFVLCDMLNEHGRDALMVSGLHAGGKVIMKALWREYEKQRYVGKG